MGIRTYKDMIKEMSLIDKELKKFDNLEKITDSKLLLKKINKKLEDIKELFKNITPEEVILSKLPYHDKNKNSYRIKWSTKLDISLTRLENILSKIEDNDVYEKLKLETRKLIVDYLEIDIETNNFNSIHFILDLPEFYKNIGLGIKVFLSAINKFNYISSVVAGPEQASFEAKMVFDHLFRNDEVYTVTKYNSGLLFISKKMNIDDIKTLVEKYLHNVNKEDYAVDKFLKKII